MAHFFSKEDRDKANSYNLVDLLRYSGYTVVKANGGYHLKEHDSLKISEYQGWNWFSRGIGGKNVDFFVTMENLNFSEACERIFNLMNEKVYKTDIEIDDTYRGYNGEDGDYRRPAKNENNKRVAAYLIKTRGIDKELVFKLLNSGNIYESKNSHNCVFVGKDYDGNIVSSFERGTGDTKFVRDTYGSNKNYRFRISNPRSDKVNVFEAEIDLLSYISIYGDKNENYIALGGVSDKALKTFLEENKSDIRHINLCLDNDEAGNSAAQKLMEVYNLGYEVTREKPKLKDFNEDLLSSKNFNKGVEEGNDMSALENKKNLNKYEETFIEALSFMEFELGKDKDGYLLIDLQSANLGGIEQDRFKSATAIIERLDIYWNDYFFASLQEAFEKMEVSECCPDTADEWLKFAEKHSNFKEYYEWDLQVLEMWKHGSEINLEKCISNHSIEAKKENAMPSINDIAYPENCEESGEYITENCHLQCTHGDGTSR